MYFSLVFCLYLYCWCPCLCLFCWCPYLCLLMYCWCPVVGIRVSCHIWIFCFCFFAKFWGYWL